MNKLIKTWTLRNKEITKADIIWLKHWSDRAITTNDPYMQCHTGGHFGGGEIAIETSSIEQESMLQLKYGDDLLLVMQEYVLSGYMPCTLQGIEF